MDTLKIDIENDPPTQAEINAWRELLTKEKSKLETRLKRTSTGGKVLCGLVVVGLVAFFVSLVQARGDFDIKTTIAVGFIFFPVCLTIVTKALLDFFNEAQKKVNTDIEQLEKIKPEFAPDFVKWREANPTVAAYQAKIVEQDRAIIMAEVSAVKAFLQLEKVRHMRKIKEAKETRAQEQLKLPIKVQNGF